MECTTTCNSSENLCDSNDKNDFDDSKEAEGVWSSDIEKSFTEALAMYPPCGRRKIVLTEEGKMYGRNELIARYIKTQTGKSRSRKQVSSHIQVLARRKTKDIQSQIQEKHTREHARQHLASMSSAQIVSDLKLSENLSLGSDGHKSSKFIDHSINSFTNTSSFSSSHNPLSLAAGSKSLHNNFITYRHPPHTPAPSPHTNNTSNPYLLIDSPTPDLLNHTFIIPHMSPMSSPQSDASLHAGPHIKPGRGIATEKIRLVELSAFLEISELPVKFEKFYHTKKYWRHLFAQLNANDDIFGPPFLESIDIYQISDKYPESDGLKEFFDRGPQDAFFMVKFWIDISQEVCPQFNQAWTITFEGVDNIKIKLSTKLCSFGRQVLDRIEEKSPSYENGVFIYRFENDMCDYMRKFIIKLSALEERSMMNSVLENFTILQTVVNAFTGEILLCIAFAMEVSVVDRGSQYHIYKLVSHSNMAPLSNI